MRLDEVTLILIPQDDFLPLAVEILEETGMISRERRVFDGVPTNFMRLTERGRFRAACVDSTPH
jgi:hypothetical protein